MKKINWLLALLLSITAVAQENPKVENIKTDHPQTKDYITFDIIPILENIAPRYKLGYIHRFTEDWAAGIDLSYGNDAIKIDLRKPDNVKSFEIFEVAPQVYYTFNPGRKVEQYIGAKLLYLSQKTVFVNSVYNSKNRYSLISYDQANYERLKLGIYLNYGIFLNFNERFGMNPYAGLGLRYRKNNYSNLVNSSEYIRDNTDHFSLWENYFKEEGVKKGGLDFQLGLKFYFRIN